MNDKEKIQEALGMLDELDKQMNESEKEYQAIFQKDSKNLAEHREQIKSDALILMKSIRKILES
jgi:hypothetical protein